MASASLVSSSPLLHLMIFLAFIMCLQLAPITMAQSVFPYAECSTTSGNFTNNSSYQTTLTSLFSSINSRLIRYGFFNASLNSKAEKVTAMGFCRGDVPPIACQICLQTSASDVRQLCPNQKEAIVWNDNCTFRYSNRSILNTDETDPNYQLINTQTASNQTQFNTALQSLLEDIRPVAAAGGSLRKLATSNTSVEFQKIYALVQCTPNLSEQQCSDCLATIIGEIPQCCAGKIGGRVMAPSCYLRFETDDRFFDDPAGALMSPPAPLVAKAPSPAPTTPPPEPTLRHSPPQSTPLAAPVAAPPSPSSSSASGQLSAQQLLFHQMWTSSFISCCTICYFSYLEVLYLVGM